MPETSRHEHAGLARRDFLKLATNGLLIASGLIGLGVILRFLGYETEPPPQTEFDLGPASNFPADSRTILSHIPAILIHTPAGFSALSLICPHLGCTVEQDSDGFSCPCHGSHYDREGGLQLGPAQKPLRKLRLEQKEDGTLTIYTAS
ncbi:MAG: ubiquinol-cytochrome c reductase iron-sulfur subunit [Chloroflexi bacterium]|nr:MAG: ubiquinol-cytochrome c reductase iron-sulfur subunit [Chloroflexota bacterium]